MGWDLWNSSGCKSRIINVHQIIRRRIQQGLARIFVFALIPGVFETLNDGVINILDVSRMGQYLSRFSLTLLFCEKLAVSSRLF